MNSLESVNVWHGVLGVEVVPFFIGWKVDFNWSSASKMGHMWSRLADLWRDKNVRSEHELVVKVESMNVLWEFVPHWSDDGCAMGTGLVEQVVKVVRDFVSVMDSLPDNVLYARTLKPWLSHQVVLASVCTHEGEVYTKLIELNEDVIVWDAVESWNIGSTEDNSGNSL